MTTKQQSWCVMATLALAACSDSKSAAPIPDDCNPLGGQACVLPWPSATYETADASTATGMRLDIPADAMPSNTQSVQINPSPYNHWDGFSAVGPMLAEFPTGVSATNLPPYTDPSQSLAADSPIVLLDMDTGERAPFFAEVDQNVALNYPERANLIIRPLMRLHSGAHYAVAIRNTVLDVAGKPLEPSPAFKAIRDGGTFDHPRFADQKTRSAAMFTALAAAGVDKSELVLAWDFTVASDDFLTSDLLAMTAAAVPAMGTNGANLTFTVTEQPPTDGFYKMYDGTFKSPTFLTDGVNDDSLIMRGDDYKPQLVGLRDAHFIALIPTCATTATSPRPTFVFGHGLFGAASGILSDGFTQELAKALCFNVVAGDFIGLSSDQIPLAGTVANDLNKAPQLTEKLGQSVIDFIALETATRNAMATSSQFAFNGTPLIDPSRMYYVGVSLGGIMGNMFMAYDPNITRAALGVPGANWSLLFERSQAFSLMQTIAVSSYTDPSEYELILSLLAMSFEKYDPITTAAHELSDNFPGVPAKHIDMWYSVGDCLVTNIATEMLIRTMGIDMLAPSVKTPWNVTPMNPPLDSAVTLFDEHAMPLPPTVNTPPAVDNKTHETISERNAVTRMVNAYLLNDSTDPTGTVVPECLVSGQPAACDCATGACD